MNDSGPSRMTEQWIHALGGFLLATAVVVGITATIYLLLGPAPAEPSAGGAPGGLLIVMALTAAGAASVARTSRQTAWRRSLFLYVAAAAGAYHIVQFARFGYW